MARQVGAPEVSPPAPNTLMPATVVLRNDVPRAALAAAGDKNPGTLTRNEFGGTIHHSYPPHPPGSSARTSCLHQWTPKLPISVDPQYLLHHQLGYCVLCVTYVVCTVIVDSTVDSATRFAWSGGSVNLREPLEEDDLKGDWEYDLEPQSSVQVRPGCSQECSRWSHAVVHSRVESCRVLEPGTHRFASPKGLPIAIIIGEPSLCSIMQL